MSKHRGTVSLDFDGVLHSYMSGWTGYVPEDPPTPGALEFVKRLHDAGFTCVVVTTRADTTEGLAATHEWLHRYGFPTMNVTAQKVPAVAYVDDRAVVCAPMKQDSPATAFDGAFDDVEALAVKK